MLFVYGIVRAGHPAPGGTGLGTPPSEVTMVESGPLAAAVTELPDGYAISEEDARAHLNVLIRLLKHGPVVPLRIGTVAPDADAVRAEVLDGVQTEMVSRLDALDGLVELHVDVDDDETEAISSVVRSAGLQPVPPGDLDAQLELGERIADLLTQRRGQLAEEILAELRPIAVADIARSVSQAPEGPVLRWAFLVKRDDIDTFDEAVVAVRSHHPSMSIRYVGPLPAVHFVDWPQAEPTPSEDDFSGSGRWGF